MLEAEEVDVDYFTPSTSTSLALLFNTNAQGENAPDNSSLKYNPPLPPQIPTKLEEPKQTQYLFAGTVMAYEWFNKSHEFRGKLGFAILKIISSGIYKVIIYDSNKTSLSCLTILSSTEIKVNENISISYYDNQQKFWSIYPSTPNLKEILEILRHLGVKLEFACKSKIGTVSENDDINKKIINKSNDEEKESDTDASSNRKTKDSILRRMATMGQSVLPLPQMVINQTSDSSDTNESHNQVKVRHKPKLTHKKSNMERKSLEIVRNKENTTYEIAAVSLPKIQAKPTCLNTDQQTFISTPNNVKSIMHVSTEENNINLFISEQRISNTELRINMNRIADKIDTLLDKVDDLDINDNTKIITHNNTSHFQHEIIHKLLNEYEKKINKYEDFIKLKGFDYDTLDVINQNKWDTKNPNVEHNEIDVTKLYNLEQICIEKDKEIAELRNQLQLASNQSLQYQNKESNFMTELSDLKHEINLKDNEIADLHKKLSDGVKNDLQNFDISNKLKEIMNNTYQAISINFTDEDMYAGSTVKSIVGLVVKKTTIDSLK